MAVAPTAKTMKWKLFQGRPASPTEFVRSIVRELHPPMDAGADTVTIGFVARTGASTSIDEAATVFQVPQPVSATVLHIARIILPLTVTLLPTARLFAVFNTEYFR